MSDSPDAIPLESPPTDESAPQSAADRRPRMPEPLPVRLVAIDDVLLLSPPGIEDKLDAFYIDLLQFQRLESALAYQSENFVLRFDVQPDRPVLHESLRAQGIEVQSLLDAQRKLNDLEIEYIPQRGLTLGSESLLLLDPAGNWLELVESRLVQ